MEFALAIPTSTPSHPLYALSFKENGEHASLFNDTALGGSLTMTSVRIGKA